MKKLERFKTIQLLVFGALSFLCIYLIVFSSDVYHQIADSKELQLVCLLLWVTLFSAFFFVFLDFSLYAKQKSDFNALDYAVHSDALAKIANRQGIDEVIEKYVDQPLPENMGCAMFLLTSLNEINRTHTRSEGNAQIRNFSIILKLASTDICFVGRNGGNVFMAIFEDTSDEKIDIFMERIEEKVKEYNQKKDNLPMYYQYGIAFHEEPPAANINALISLSSRRAHESDTCPNNIAYIAQKQIQARENKPIAIPKSNVVDTVIAKDVKDVKDIKDTKDIKDVKDIKETNEVVAETVAASAPEKIATEEVVSKESTVSEKAVHSISHTRKREIPSFAIVIDTNAKAKSAAKRKASKKSEEEKTKEIERLSYEEVRYSYEEVFGGDDEDYFGEYDYEVEVAWEGREYKEAI